MKTKNTCAVVKMYLRCVWNWIDGAARFELISKLVILGQKFESFGLQIVT